MGKGRKKVTRIWRLTILSVELGSRYLPPNDNEEGYGGGGAGKKEKTALLQALSALVCLYSILWSISDGQLVFFLSSAHTVSPAPAAHLTAKLDNYLMMHKKK